MKSLNEVVEMFGMRGAEEVKDESGEVVVAASNPAEGFGFYGIALSAVEGNPIEFASSKCSQDCYATMDEETLYVATKGTCSVGTEIK